MGEKVISRSAVVRIFNKKNDVLQNTNERRRRINNIIIAVTCVFFVSWLPLNVFQLMSEFGQSGYKVLGMTGNEEVVYGMLHLLGTANACFNPILYGYLNENFRNEYKSIYRRMPWYSHSFHANEAVHVVQIPADRQSVVDEMAISRQQLLMNQQKNGTTTTNSDSGKTTSSQNEGQTILLHASGNDNNNLNNSVVLGVTAPLSESSRTFSSADGVTPNLDDVVTSNCGDDPLTLNCEDDVTLNFEDDVTLNFEDDVTLNCDDMTMASCDVESFTLAASTSSRFLHSRPQHKAVVVDERGIMSDVFSNKYVHQAIGQIVTSLESCEERKLLSWVSPKRNVTMETYV